MKSAVVTKSDRGLPPPPARIETLPAPDTSMSSICSLPRPSGRMKKAWYASPAIATVSS